MENSKNSRYELLRFEQIDGIFRVSTTDSNNCSLSSYNRRDFYKISLILEGSSDLYYANRTIHIDQPALIFTNPLIPYSWDETSANHVRGQFCVFTDEFLKDGGRMESLQESSLFKPNGDPVYLLNPEQVTYLESIFNKMHAEMNSDYLYKHELVRNFVYLLMHEAIKMEPAMASQAPKNAAMRITSLFLTLLDKQFPVDSPQYAIQLKKASDYATQLAVHVNHLNAAVQEITGRSTTTHINEKILAEARSLLVHTDWSVSDIAFCLGFEYVSYFNNFFKKHTGNTPLKTRQQGLVESIK